VKRVSESFKGLGFLIENESAGECCMSIDYGPRPLRITLTALVVLVLGALMAVGGAYLTVLGGSWYYLVAGIGLLVVAGLLFARRRAAIWLYAVLLLNTALDAL
jgi:quinoprotein glucose dehydrogenase